MRAPALAALVASLATSVMVAPAPAAIRVVKSDGQDAAAHEATLALDPKTGGWNITLMALYAPGDWSLYEIHGDGGEVIDRLTIDVPCWSPFGSCLPGGSPVVVRVLSQGGTGIRTVREIVQTGTAETLLNKVDVTEDIGRVEVEAIGELFAGRDVLGPIIATTPDNPGRGINRIEVGRDILGDVSAEQGYIQLLWTEGRIGTEARPVTIRAKHGVNQIVSFGGVWGDIDTRVNGGAGWMFAFGAASFTGSLETERFDSQWGPNWPGRVSVWGPCEGTIVVGASFNDPAQWMEFTRNPLGLAGQIIINADGDPEGSWTSPIRIGYEGDTGRFTLPAPAYPQTPDEIGGGSVGVVPFALHDEASMPVSGAEVTIDALGAVRVRHYGPVELAGSEPLRFERRAAGGADPYEPVPAGDFEVGVDPSDANTVLVTAAPGGAGFEPGFAYRITATDDLVCAIGNRLPVAWTTAYGFTVTGLPCVGDVNGTGAVTLADLLAVLAAWGPCEGCPADVDGSGRVDFGDLLAVLAAWGPC